MKKEAKSPPDAIQQKLRDHKKKWNPIVSDFINDVIHFKKLMNGAPNKFYQQKGDIKHAIPADPATIIGVLANDFNEIAQEAKAIIEEQVAYSHNRRKRQSKNMEQMSLPLGEPPSDLEQQLTASVSENKIIKLASSFEGKYLLESSASNPISRFFARLFTSTFGFSDAANIRRARMSMLNSAATSWKKLEQFQVLITKKSSDSLQQAYKKLMEAHHSWKQVETGFNEAKKLLPKDIKDTGGKIPDKTVQDMKNEEDASKGKNTSEKPAPESSNKSSKEPSQENENSGLVDAAVLAEQDIVEAMELLSKESRIQTNLITLIESFKTHQDDNSAKILLSKYHLAIKILNKKYKTNESTLSGINKLLKSKDLEAKAQASLKKWIGKKRHQLLPNNTSFLRLSAYDKAEESMKAIDQIMDSLEDGLSVEELEPLIKTVNSEMGGLLSSLRHLYLAK